MSETGTLLIRSRRMVLPEGVAEVPPSCGMAGLS
jgi:hypothetical protein